MQVVQRIGVGSAAKVYGLTLGILGIFIGIIYAAIFSFIGSIGSDLKDSPVPIFGAGVGMAMMIIIPIFYGIIGFVFGALGAVIYNFIAKKFGGLEIELYEPNSQKAD